MNVTDSQEIWQIDIGDQVYEATFDVMAQWISEGALLPQDKVRRGNLRWIEARRVPALVPFFNAKETGAPAPIVASTAFPPSEPSTTATFASSAPSFPSMTAGPPADPFRGEIVEPALNPTFGGPPAVGLAPPEPDQTVFEIPHEDVIPPELPKNCSMHSSSPAFFVCESCANVFCKLCPKTYGSVRICPFCGAGCQRIEQQRRKDQQAAEYRSAVTGGFGFSDFGAAFSYPFRFKTSLVFGAVLFMIFTLGQNATAFGGIFMLSAALMCYMLGNMLYFGILTNVLENFSQGFTDRNFMPSFDEFSLWDDVVHPFFLSIAVYIVSFGMFIAVIGGSVLYLVKSAPTLPGAQNSAVPSGEDIARFNKAFGDANRKDPTSAEDEEEQFRKLDEFIREQRKKQLESGIGKTPETVQKERSEFVSKILAMAGPILILGGLAFLWGIFYLPAACMVAGYTRSFVATINPKVGLDTIRVLGGDYAKILLMGFIVAILSGFVGMILAIVFFPFALPGVGNLPAIAVGSLFSFYLSVVFSVVLGFALYKNADKLQLYRG